MAIRKKLPKSMAVRILKPRLFILKIYWLLQKDLARPATFKDFLVFFDTNEKELRKFIETKTPPYMWLNKLAQTERGRDLLEYFNIEYLEQSPMLCLDPNWENVQEITPEIDSDTSQNNITSFQKKKKTTPVVIKKVLSKKERLLEEALDQIKMVANKKDSLSSTQARNRRESFVLEDSNKKAFFLLYYLRN